MLFIVLVGTLTIFVSSFWVITKPQHRCRDSIVLVKGKLDNAACDPNQAISYMQDLMGERYIVCRCRTDRFDETEEVDRPDVPNLLFEPPTDESVPRIESNPDKGPVL